MDKTEFVAALNDLSTRPCPATATAHQVRDRGGRFSSGCRAVAARLRRHSQLSGVAGERDDGRLAAPMLDDPANLALILQFLQPCCPCWSTSHRPLTNLPGGAPARTSAGHLTGGSHGREPPVAKEPEPCNR